MNFLNRFRARPARPAFEWVLQYAGASRWWDFRRVPGDAMSAADAYEALADMQARSGGLVAPTPCRLVVDRGGVIEHVCDPPPWAFRPGALPEGTLVGASA